MQHTQTSLALLVGKALQLRGLKLATAESCTGGGISHAITAIAGSSAWFDRGFVTYSNEAKQQMLAVADTQIEKYGAVSKEVATQMAIGAVKNSAADMSVAVTGVAGPSGGSKQKPVGLVWFAWSIAGKTCSYSFKFNGDRARIRDGATMVALKGLLAMMFYGEVSADALGKINSFLNQRYFFALWPPVATTTTIKQRLNLLQSQQMHFSLPQDYHLTLAFLGVVDPLLLKKFQQAAAAIKFQPFEVTLDSITHWHRAQVLVLQLPQTPPPLMQLFTDLQKNLEQYGFMPEKHKFVPHVTVAKKVKDKVGTKLISPIKWQAASFYLACSNTGAEGGRYRKIAEFSSG